ncbi:hypothetical protein [Nonomuraea dietziae]|uniref:hypothetical protein n=1 Tax=Nonomuraea dietziae TaxID=65515 RepID=UPI003408903B
MTVTGLTLAAAACSVPPVEVGSARPTGGALGLRTEPGRYLQGDRWPDACHLLTDGELKAVLPQAEEVSRKPRGLNLTEIPDFLTGKGGGTEPGQYYFETWGHTSAELAGADAYSAASSDAFRDKVLSQVVRTLLAKMA